MTGPCKLTRIGLRRMKLKEFLVWYVSQPVSIGEIVEMVDLINQLHKKDN